jgi:hypothetical protein
MSRNARRHRRAGDPVGPQCAIVLAHAPMLEPIVRPLPNWRQVRADIAPLYAINGLIGFIFAATGPVAVILAVGSRGGLSQAQIASWVFGAFFVNGLLTLIACTLYVGWRLALRPGPYRTLAIPVWSALFLHILQGMQIDTDHWRHLYLLFGLVWGLAAASDRAERRGAPAHLRASV